MRVGEVAERAGVNVETLRYYERRGLLPTPDRAPSGHRVYDEETVRFLRAIKEAQAVGFTLAEIAEYLRAARRSSSPSEALRVRMTAKIDQIDARIGALRRMRDELARVVGCSCTSLDHCTCGAAYLARRGKEPTVRSTLLHVTNGESAGNTLRQTTLGGAVVSWQDVLHEGPVPALPRPELLRTRARFLADCGWGSEAALRSSLERRDRQLLDALRDGTEVVLWFEHDLYDQLQLIDALTLARSVDAAPELIVIGSFPGKPSFAGLGELTANELETLWPSRTHATPEALATAAAAWSALCEPEPTALSELATRDDPHLPFLAPALRRLLDELPAPTDGLSRTERLALESIAAGARTAPAAFVASQRREDAPFLGDTWFFRTLSALGQGENRLVEGDGEPLPPPPPLSDGQTFMRLDLRVTDAGERVLRGEANRVELLGIDRWVGGTHVTRD
ncbi:MAG TPA: MerR family transcriptional regulator [Gaiellaceae bacterium]|nr:MerR family transcriptional regulator [Gaiellaceae bacterium]